MRDATISFTFHTSPHWRGWWDTAALWDGERRYYARWLWFSLSLILHPTREVPA